jgi:hypothetical protein
MNNYMKKQLCEETYSNYNEHKKARLIRAVIN